jgi:hypothetical protein
VSLKFAREITFADSFKGDVTLAVELKIENLDGFVEWTEQWDPCSIMETQDHYEQLA